jgi:hypothetical protein
MGVWDVLVPFFAYQDSRARVRITMRARIRVTIHHERITMPRCDCEVLPTNCGVVQFGCAQRFLSLTGIKDGGREASTIAVAQNAQSPQKA